MKNIHILPTDKTSRLIHNDANQLIYQSNNSFKNDKKWMYRKAFNICITNDEEIKDGDWYLDTFNTARIKANQFSDHKHYGSTCKKIILTTDPALIKNGVQAIDDEFLEWFVKNPSCEEVKVEWLGTYTYGIVGYKTIIPKQETALEEAAEKYEPKSNKWTIQEIFKDGAKWQKEQDNEVIQNLKDRLDTVRHINTTVIKAVEKLKEQYDIDVINAFNEGQALSVRGKLIQGKEWFEKFKNK